MNLLKSGFRLGAALPLPLVEGRDKNISHVRPIAVGGKPRRAATRSGAFESRLACLTTPTSYFQSSLVYFLYKYLV